jgi:staphylococcal nuclease domain-containing protein 1
MTKFKSFHLDKKNDQPLPGPPKVGDILAAKFTVDNDWYRARVRRVDREAKKADVTYLDYGNSETIPWTRLRPLSQPQFSTQTLKPQAVDALLSYLQFPTTAHYLDDAVAFISQQTDGRQLVANVDFISDGTLYITLMSPGSNLEQTVNAEVIREGLAMVPRKLKAWEKAAGDTVTRLKTLEEEAKEGRLGMWEYGELDED